MNSALKRPIRRALISVYDKSRLAEIGNALTASGVEIVATGSTAQALADSGIAVTEVSTYTGFPEVMGGRVKTLHPRIHAGILADQNNPSHMKEIGELDISPFDLVIINLYPFAETIKTESTYSEAIEQIDIGGPAMLRAAAKNHNSVAVISSVRQYDLVLAAVSNGGFDLKQRQVLALEVFRTTAEYDLTIATWLAQQIDHDPTSMPEWFGKIYKQSTSLRYGENPHQKAALYSDGGTGIVQAEQLHGKEMSFNNYVDAEAAWRSVLEHSEPCVAIIKHANPCGIALGATIQEAYTRAHECDPVSAFGGVVAANRTVNSELANQLSSIFTEVVIAPGYETEALEILRKKPSLRILTAATTSIQQRELRPISGGALLQDTDLNNATGDEPASWKQVAGPAISEEVIRDLAFAWRSVRSVKSNAIVIARNQAAVGVGMGQVNRVDASRLAVERARSRAQGAVAASDAFFPFADGVEILISAGVMAIVQPGGSIRDEEVIAAAESAGVAMFFTGTRHFSHA